MSTILISALVALVVSLGTEWFAKPLLEARKDRILEHHRNVRRAATIAIDAFHRLGERIDTGRDTGKPEHVDEFRSLQHHTESVWGKRDRDAMRIMVNAFLYPGLDPIYPMLDGHPRTEEEDLHLAYWAALILVTPRYRLKRRQDLYRELQRLISIERRSEDNRRRRRSQTH